MASRRCGSPVRETAISPARSRAGSRTSTGTRTTERSTSARCWSPTISPTTWFRISPSPGPATSCGMTIRTIRQPFDKVCTPKIFKSYLAGIPHRVRAGPPEEPRAVHQRGRIGEASRACLLVTSTHRSVARRRRHPGRCHRHLRTAGHHRPAGGVIHGSHRIRQQDGCPPRPTAPTGFLPAR